MQSFRVGSREPQDTLGGRRSSRDISGFTYLENLIPDEPAPRYPFPPRLGHVIKQCNVKAHKETLFFPGSLPKPQSGERWGVLLTQQTTTGKHVSLQGSSTLSSILLAELTLSLRQLGCYPCVMHWHSQVPLGLHEPNLAIRPRQESP